MTSDAALRWVARALVLPSMVFASALAAHAAGDGVIPRASVLASMFVLTVVVVAAFAEARISPLAVVMLLLGGQAILHAAFQLLGGTGGMIMTATQGGDLAADVMVPSCHLMTAPAATASHGSATSLLEHDHLVMVLAHLVAAVVVGVWLAAGERAFWMVLLLAARPVAGAWRTLTAVARDRAGSTVVSRQRLQPSWILRRTIRASLLAVGVVVSRRGPPQARRRPNLMDALVSAI
jgi:hypothetical protein